MGKLSEYGVMVIQELDSYGFNEYMLDQGSYGISGVYVAENDEDATCPVRYTAWDIKSMCLMRARTV